MADYRSYREMPSVEYLQSVGFNTTDDSVYPDLVFSLPKQARVIPHKVPNQPQTVGLGVIGYYGWRHDTKSGETLFLNYLAKLKRFFHWLLDQGYVIRLLIGDLGIDQRPVEELVDFVRTEGRADWQDLVFADAIADVNELLEQITMCDIVVANRFHNVVCALMVGRPVISIGYHDKNNALMAEMGLESYCQHIEHFEVDVLCQQFQSLVSDSSQVSRHIQEKCAQYRRLLDDQYRIILSPETAETRGD